MARDHSARTAQDSGIVRKLDHDESVIVTRKRTPVGELTPVHRRQFVSVSAALEAFASSAPLDPRRFRNDINRVVDQSIGPRAPYRDSL